MTAIGPLYGWKTNALDDGTEARIGMKEVECRFLPHKHQPGRPFLNCTLETAQSVFFASELRIVKGESERRNILRSRLLQVSVVPPGCFIRARTVSVCCQRGLS
jgi:hypothetical protein